MGSRLRGPRRYSCLFLVAGASEDCAIMQVRCNCLPLHLYLVGSRLARAGVVYGGAKSDPVPTTGLLPVLAVLQLVTW